MSARTSLYGHKLLTDLVVNCCASCSPVAHYSFNQPAGLASGNQADINSHTLCVFYLHMHTHGRAKPHATCVSVSPISDRAVAYSIFFNGVCDK